MYELPLCRIQMTHEECCTLTNDFTHKMLEYSRSVLNDFGEKLTEHDKTTVINYLTSWFASMFKHYVEEGKDGYCDGAIEEYHGSCRFPRFHVSSVLTIL